MKKILFLPLLFIMFSCNSDDDNNVAIQTLPAFTIGTGELYGDAVTATTAQNIVIDNQADYNIFLDDLSQYTSATEIFDNSQVNFETRKVIAIYNRQRPVGGYSLAIDIVENESNFIITLIETAPESTAIAVASRLFYVAAIPTTSKPIIFQ